MLTHSVNIYRLIHLRIYEWKNIQTYNSKMGLRNSVFANPRLINLFNQVLNNRCSLYKAFNASNNMEQLIVSIQLFWVFFVYSALQRLHLHSNLMNSFSGIKGNFAPYLTNLKVLNSFKEWEEICAIALNFTSWSLFQNKIQIFLISWHQRGGAA